MPRRLRILQTGHNKYIIQVKGLFFWSGLDKTGHPAPLIDDELEDQWTHAYPTLSAALTAAYTFSFVPRVVWQSTQNR